MWGGIVTPSKTQLDQLSTELLSAPKDSAMIEQLCIRPDFGKRDFVDHVHAIRETGLVGCRWASHPWMSLPDGSGDPRIQVSILQKRVCDIVYDPTDPEDTHPGDTFMVDMDLSEANLPVGSLLQVGTTVLMVSDVWNNACVKWKARYGQEAFDWVRAAPTERRRGVLCEIFVDGVISTGDTLVKL